MKIICLQNFIVLLFCFHTFAQVDSCDMQKEAAKNYASHIEEKDKYHQKSVLLGTFLPLVGPLAIETKALIADVKPVDNSDQSYTTTNCFQNEYTKRVKIERSKEVLKGGLQGAGISVLLYGLVFVIWAAFMF